MALSAETWKSIRLAVLEAALVVFGVVLALLANEWRKAASEAEAARTARAHIIEEMRANRQAAAASLEYHQGLLGALRGHREKKTTPPMSLFSRGFISPARLNRAAWLSASETGATTHFPYADVLSLSEVYLMQDRYEDQVRSVGLVFYGEIARGGTRSLAKDPGSLASVINLFAHRERELIAMYDRKLSQELPLPGAPPGEESAAR